MWIAKFGTVLVQPEDQADHEEVHAEPHQRLHVGPQQAQQRALVARLDLLLHEQLEQVATPEDVDQAAAGERRGQRRVASAAVAGGPGRRRRRSDWAVTTSLLLGRGEPRTSWPTARAR